MHFAASIRDPMNDHGNLGIESLPALMPRRGAAQESRNESRCSPPVGANGEIRSPDVRRRLPLPAPADEANEASSSPACQPARRRCDGQRRPRSGRPAPPVTAVLVSRSAQGRPCCRNTPVHQQARHPAAPVPVQIRHCPSPDGQPCTEVPAGPGLLARHARNQAHEARPPSSYLTLAGHFSNENRSRIYPDVTPFTSPPKLAHTIVWCAAIVVGVEWPSFSTNNDSESAQWA